MLPRPNTPPLSARSPRRAALTLLEVLISLAIFLLSLVGIVRLIGMGNERALDIQLDTEALHRCQSKLGEVVCGAVPLQAQEKVAFEDDPAWEWSLECAQNTVANLWTVKVTVARPRQDGVTNQVTLFQLVLNPTVRGGTAQGSAAESGSSSSSSSSGSSSTPPP
ncbi:MAG: prepilin-type N-terminal cleavage/methylation domain-containing protein [Gemmataceae bacterium]|nr:prepilin-type N-terminal cleavage/methylation domain-containing protein [Gemmataceae bacterium]